MTAVAEKEEYWEFGTSGFSLRRFIQMNYYQGDKITEGEMRRVSTTHKGGSKYIYIFVRKLEGKVDNTCETEAWMGGQY
jgi:hypothetical protein